MARPVLSFVPFMLNRRAMSRMQVDSIFRLTQAEGAALTAVLASALAAVINGVNLMLGFVMLAAMLLDQVSGMLKAIVTTVPGEDWFDGHKFMRGFATKGLIIVGVLAAGLLDIAASAIPAWGAVVADVTPLTMAALAYAIIGQAASVFRNVSIVREAQLLSAFMLRRIDAAKMGHEPPIRRAAYDRAAVDMEQHLHTETGETFHDAALRRDRENDAHPTEEKSDD